MNFALAKANERQLIVLNGDTYADVDLKNLMRRFESARTDLAIAVTNLNDSARYGSLAIEEDTNTITGFSEKQSHAAGYINAGVYCLRREIFFKYSVPVKFSL